MGARHVAQRDMAHLDGQVEELQVWTRASPDRPEAATWGGAARGTACALARNARGRRGRQRLAQSHLGAGRWLWSRSWRSVSTTACAGQAMAPWRAAMGERSSSASIASRAAAWVNAEAHGATLVAKPRKKPIPGLPGGLQSSLRRSGTSERLGPRHLRGGRRACERRPRACGCGNGGGAACGARRDPWGPRARCARARRDEKRQDVVPFWLPGADAS